MFLLTVSIVIRMSYEEDEDKSNINAAIVVQFFPIIVFTCFYGFAVYLHRSFSNWLFVALYGPYTVSVSFYYLTDLGADLDSSGVVLLGNIAIFNAAICSFMLQVRFAPYIFIRIAMYMCTATGLAIKSE